MTTIAYRDGVLASDSRETSTNGEVGDDGFVIDSECEKIWRLPDGQLFGAAHASEDCTRLYMALLTGDDMPALDDVAGILIALDGSYRLYDGHIWVPGRLPYYALGSGARFAFAAFKAGASAQRACEIGAEMDPYSGFPVVSLNVYKIPS